MEWYDFITGVEWYWWVIAGLSTVVILGLILIRSLVGSLAEGAIAVGGSWLKGNFGKRKR